MRQANSIFRRPARWAALIVGAAVILWQAAVGDAQDTADLFRRNCMNYHTIGGGRLGPDLTNIYERLKGPKALSAWLMAPGTETMQPIFASHPMTADEIHALAAYFEASAGESLAEPAASRVAFLLMGLILATGIVFAFDAIWKRRFHSVRQPLVDATPVRGLP